MLYEVITGGAALLKEPETIYQILKTVRAALPANQLLSAKVRLGWSSPEECYEIIDAVIQGGAGELSIHARTKEDGYKSDAIKWEWIQRVRNRIPVPLIANGEIWSFNDAVKCQMLSGCDDLMVGRGALQLPNLGAVITQQQAPMSWDQVYQLLLEYIEISLSQPRSDYISSRVKQWLVFLKQQYDEAADLFRSVRTFHDTAAFVDQIKASKA